MKWVPVVEKANRKALAVLGARGIYILLAILTLLLLSGANDKWGG